MTQLNINLSETTPQTINPDNFIGENPIKSPFSITETKKKLQDCINLLSNSNNLLSINWSTLHNSIITSYYNNCYIQIECFIFLSSKDSSILILFKHYYGNKIFASNLIDLIKNEWYKTDTSEEGQQIYQFNLHWNLFENELYPKSTERSIENIKQLMEFSISNCLHIEVVLNNIETLASACTNSVNRQIFLENNGIETIENWFSVSSDYQIKLIGLSIIYSCLIDTNIPIKIRNNLKQIWTNGSRVKTSFYEMMPNKRIDQIISIIGE